LGQARRVTQLAHPVREAPGIIPFSIPVDHRWRQRLITAGTLPVDEVIPPLHVGDSFQSVGSGRCQHQPLSQGLNQCGGEDGPRESAVTRTISPRLCSSANRPRKQQHGCWKTRMPRTICLISSSSCSQSGYRNTRKYIRAKIQKCENTMHRCT
jgi:hypothetical protein